MNQSFDTAVKSFVLDNKPCIAFAARITGREPDGTPRCTISGYASTPGGKRDPQDSLYMAAAAQRAFEHFIETFGTLTGKPANEIRAMVDELVIKMRINRDRGNPMT